MSVQWVRVGMADPGGKKDSFFFVLCDVDKSNKIIYVTGAFSWKFEEGRLGYPEVERDLATIHSSKRLDFLVVEKNNTGIHVIQTMQNQYHIPIVSITTANNIKSRAIIQKGDTMDKVEHVEWLNASRQKHKVKISKNMTPGLKKLLAQIDSYVVERTPSGKRTYKAQGNQPDDAVSALLVGTFFIRRKIFGEMGGGKHFIARKKYNVGEVERHIKSAIPPDSKLLGRSVVNPSGVGYGGYRIT